MNTAKAVPLLSLEDTLAHLREKIVPISEGETVPLGLSSGRVLAEPLLSPITVPGFDNSAMDGYAFCGRDVAPHTRELVISSRVMAGDRPSSLTTGTACRIFTGAPLPQGADTVVIQEECREQEGRVVLPEQWSVGNHVRRAGEDFRAGDILLSKGQRLSPQAIGLAASCGLTQLRVQRRVRVALLSTGNELREAGGGPLQDGQIYDSNRPMLRALLEAMNCEVTSAGPVPDEVDATKQALRETAAFADVIVTTGGVSVGEEDHVKAALQAEGSLSLWRVAIKPGKPLAFGRLGKAYFLGLPGNPVSSFVTFLLFVQPFLRELNGEPPCPLRGFPVRAAFTRSYGDKRREFVRAQLVQGADETIWAKPYSRQSSGVLSSTTWADGLLDIAGGRTVSEGDVLPFLPFEGLVP